jgi:hypothetical protein
VGTESPSSQQAARTIRQDVAPRGATSGTLRRLRGLLLTAPSRFTNATGGCEATRLRNIMPISPSPLVSSRLLRIEVVAALGVRLDDYT